MKTPLLVKVTAVLAVAVLALSVVSVWFHGDAKGGFAWLFPVVGFCWILWIVCLFATRDLSLIGRLVGLWWLINAIPLALFLSFASDVPNWATSNGVDAVLMLAYFPVIIPSIFAVGLIPIDLAPHAGSSLSGAFTLWLMVSVVAAVQSGLIATVLGLVRRRKGNQSKVALS